MALLTAAQVPDADWRKAWRLAFAQLRQEVDLHPTGPKPADIFAAAARTTRVVAEQNLPLSMGLVMHLYPLCALRCVTLPWWSPANYRRHRLLRAIDRNGLILANAGSERVAGVQSPVTLTRTRDGVLVNGAFDYVSLANVADLLLFSAPLADGASIFCIAGLHSDTARIGPPRFSGTPRLSDTCSMTFTNHAVSDDHFVVIPDDSALGCMTQYQRSWFQLLACDAHLARLEVLRERWQLARSPEEIASFNELSLLREHAASLLNGAKDSASIDSLARVTAACKLRISWHSQSIAALIQERDPVSAAELGYLKRQPTSDDRILRSIGAAPSIHQPLEVDQRRRHPRAGRRAGLAPGAHSPEPAT